MNKVYISTDAYFRSHGKEPKGRGSWGFQVMDDSCNMEVDIIWTPSMTLTEARKFATQVVNTKFAEELATGDLYLEVAP